MIFSRGLFGLGSHCGIGFLGGWHFLIMIGLAFVLAAIVIIAVRRKRAHRNDLVLDILKRRFISGEISEQEYLSRKEILSRK